MLTVTSVKSALASYRPSRLQRIRQTYGTVRLLYAISQKITSLPMVRWLVRFDVNDVFCQKVPDPEGATRAAGRYVVRMTVPDDLPALAEYYGDRQRVHDRLERGDRCVMALRNDAVGAAVWLAVGPTGFNEDWDQMRFVCRIPKGAGWSYDGKGTKLGAWGTLMKHIPVHLHELGITKLVTLIDCNNWKSIEAHRSLGYEQIGYVCSIMLLGLRFRLEKPLGQRWQRMPAQLGDVEFVPEKDPEKG